MRNSGEKSGGSLMREKNPLTNTPNEYLVGLEFEHLDFKNSTKEFLFAIIQDPILG